MAPAPLHCAGTLLALDGANIIAPLTDAHKPAPYCGKTASKGSPLLGVAHSQRVVFDPSDPGINPMTRSGATGVFMLGAGP